MPKKLLATDSPELQTGMAPGSLLHTASNLETTCCLQKNVMHRSNWLIQQTSIKSDRGRTWGPRAVRTWSFELIFQMNTQVLSYVLSISY